MHNGRSFKITDLPDSKNKTTYLVGDKPLVLYNEYNPEQLWLPFIRALFFTPANKNPNKTTYNPQAAIIKASKKQFARLDHLAPFWAARPYIYERGIEQYVMPFYEFKRVTKTEYRELSAAKLPTWERNADNQPHTVRIITKPFEVGPWCQENLDGRFHCTGKSIICQLEIDALRAKLVFG